jgi:hypothetical protein
MERQMDMLKICADDKTTDDVRGRCFEDIVIGCLITNDGSPDVLKKVLTDAKITIDRDWDAELRQPPDLIPLPNNQYPPGAYGKKKVTYFTPNTSNFPAVDLIIRVRKIVIAIQITTSEKHADSLGKLMKNVRKAGWNKRQVQKIILLYITPRNVITRNLEKRIGGGTSLSEEDWVITRFYSIDDFDSLRDIQWLNSSTK